MAPAAGSKQAAARWRGGLVGACSAATAVGAHGVGGGLLPGGAALILLVLGCAVVGTAAGGRLGCRGVGAVATFLVIGQFVGHVVLAAASGHAHGLAVAPEMAAAHLCAAVACALLICAAERLWAGLATYVWRLVRALTVTASATVLRRDVDGRGDDELSPARLGCSAGTRGPPLFA
ncbi:MAG: hypothetical protein ABWY45_16965 [Mycobacterium sp.]